MKYLLVIVTLLSILSCKKIPAVYVGFYNVENLFDTLDDPYKHDEQYTPGSDRNWDTEKYNTKLNNLAFVISQLSDNEAPHFLGLCEIENKKVVEDLISQKYLQERNYGIVHYESPDERGIDVGFLYDQSIFTVTDSKSFEVDLSAFDDKTRDILWVEGKLKNGGVLHFLVNHWPSRSGGLEKSRPKRAVAAQKFKEIKDVILADNPNAKIIAMGDFNDEPTNKSLKIAGSEGDLEQLDSLELYNTFYALDEKKKGSYKFRDNWNMLDQLLISQALIQPSQKQLYYKPKSASIKDEEWMKQHGNKYEGSPLRTFGGPNYLAGYSDHFPVYIKLIIDVTE